MTNDRANRSPAVYDPERRLWIPGRRSFLFMLGAAAIGAALPAPIEHTVSFTIHNVLPDDRVYVAIVDCNGRSVTEVYTSLKFQTRRGRR